MDDSLQPTIDMLLNVAIFMWYGAVCPWHRFVSNPTVPIYRLIPLGIMVLLFRRLPMVLAFYWRGSIHQLEDIRQAFFTGFFGPIGVSAIFYLYISREFLRDMSDRQDAIVVSETIYIVVWFLVMCSVVVHGLSIPLAKLGLYLPRTLSSAISLERPSASQSRARSESSTEGQPGSSGGRIMMRPLHGRPTTTERGPPSTNSPSMHWIPKSFIRAGKHVLQDMKRSDGVSSHAQTEVSRAEGGTRDGLHGAGAHPQISRPMNARPLADPILRSLGQVGNEDEGVKRIEEGLNSNRGINGQSSSGSDLGNGFVMPPNNRIQFVEATGQRTPATDSSRNK